MTQSTLVDSPATRTARRRTPPLLSAADYERAFKILEECDGAAALPDFKVKLIDCLQRRLGIRHISFFAGATFHNTFGDMAPLTEGQTRDMLPEYQEHWFHYDVFSTPPARRQLDASGVSSLAELTARGTLPETGAAYVRHFLHARWGMDSATALRITLPEGHTALIGMFDNAADKIGTRELATLRLLSGRLSAVSQHLPTSGSPTPLQQLPERQRKLVALVADGLSNAEIATTLTLAEDSVKKYVSRVLTLTGCQSRMELALLARSWH